MHVNDTLLKYCEFYIGHSVEHRVESTLIFIKSRQSQSATGNKNMDTSTVPNLVSYQLNHVLAVVKEAM